jgi:hypothetical protein
MDESKQRCVSLLPAASARADISPPKCRIRLKKAHERQSLCGEFLDTCCQIRDLLRQALERLLRLSRLRMNLRLKLGDQGCEDADIGL